MSIRQVTKRQQDILELIHRHTALNRVQVQKLLGHKDYKTINVWLRDLTDKGLVKRIYGDSFAERCSPAMYYLAKPGIELLLEAGVYPREDYTGRVRVPSPEQIERRYLPNEYAAQLAQANSEELQITYETRDEMAREGGRFNLFGGFGTDIGFFWERDDDAEGSTVIEVIPEGLPKQRMRRRVRAYMELYRSNELGEAAQRRFPVVSFVCPALYILISLKRYAIYLKREDERLEDMVMMFATRKNTLDAGILEDIWEEA